jgi:hypothetical protein
MDPQGQGVAQVTELKCKDPSSFPSTEPKKKKKKRALRSLSRFYKSKGKAWDSVFSTRTQTVL